MSGPSRPTNIVTMITSSEVSGRVGVIPVESPTVPNADTVSNAIGRMSSAWVVTCSSRVIPNTSATDSSATVSAR